MLLFMFQVVFAADCPSHPSDAAILEETLAVAAGLEQGDAQRFEDGMSRLQRMIGCVGEVPKVSTMARVRLYRGVHAFGVGDIDRAAAEFLAARALDPDLELPVYPEGHAIYGVLRRHDPVRASRDRLPPPRRGALYVDGYQTRDRYQAAPALVQWVNEDALQTFELEPGQVPSYPVRHPLRNTLLVSAAGLAVAGGGLIVASQGPHGRFDRSEGSSVAELTRLRSQTNALAGSGLALVGAAVGVGSLAIVFRSR